MILVIGGAHQGKLRVVQNWLGADGTEMDLIANGSCDPFAAVQTKKVIYGVQAYLARCGKEQVAAEAWLELLLAANPQYVIMDEVGSGIVPIEAAQREYRELVGAAGQRLAQAAEAVYRVICGIPVQIK